MRNIFIGAAAAAFLFCAPMAAFAAPFSSTVSTFGATTGSGPWTLTSTGSTYSGVEIDATAPITFGQLTNLSATFTDNSGGAGGGSPRFIVGLDTGSGIKGLNILLGTSAGFADSNPASFTTAFSGFNVIGNDDAGRYDVSAFGGSPFTDYTTALAALSGFNVTEIDLVTDGGWSANGTQSLTLTSLRINDATVGAPVPVPEPVSLSLFGAGLAGAAAMRRRRKVKKA